MSTLTFGTYTHEEDEVGIKIDSRTIETKYKQPIALVERWTIVGALLSNGSSAALNADMRNLETAYAPGGSTTATATFTANGNTHTLGGTTTRNGVRVMTFGYMSGPWKMRTEMSNRRAFYAVLQAEYRGNAEVVAYREEVRRFGTGGPKWRFMPSLAGFPLAQQLQAYTPVKYVQRGQLVFRSKKPAAQAPYFNVGSIHQEHVQVAEIAPEMLSKNGDELYGVEWMYPAESARQIGSSVTFSVPAL